MSLKQVSSVKRLDYFSMMLFLLCCIHFENVTISCNHDSHNVNGVLLNEINLNNSVISCMVCSIFLYHSESYF